MANKQLLKFASLLAFIVFATLGLNAQTDAKPATSAHKSMSITGCVQKGTEANGFYLTDDSGKNWELTNSAAKVADHVGQKVTVTGSAMKAPKAEEEKMATAEKEEAGGKKYGDFQVASVKMISESCK